MGRRDTGVLAAPDYAHTHANILREGEWCLNFPRFSNPYYGRVQTVGDLVHFLNLQPRFSAGEAQTSPGLGRKRGDTDG